MDQFCSNVIGYKLRPMIHFHRLSIKQWGQFSSCGVAALLNATQGQTLAAAPDSLVTPGSNIIISLNSNLIVVWLPRLRC